MAASSLRDFHYTRQALCNDCRMHELKLIKNPPLSPAFLPRGCYSISLALEIRNRHLLVDLFQLHHFFRRITVEGIQEEPPQGMSTTKLSLFPLSLLITLLLLILLLLLLNDVRNRC